MTARAIHHEITAEIRRQLAEGVRPWVRPWTNPGELPGSAPSGSGAGSRGPGLPLRDCGTPFTGINVILLWAAGGAAGFGLPHWLTYRQAAELGGQVRRGEHGTRVVLTKTLEEAPAADGSPTEPAETGSGPAVRRFLKRYTVFNAGQCDGLPDRFYAPTGRPDPAADGYEKVAAFFGDVGSSWSSRRRTAPATTPEVMSSPCRRGCGSPAKRTTGQPSRTRRRTGRDTPAG